MNISDRIVPSLARALLERGYATMTPVQEAVLEADAAGADLLVSAQTGSGKTVAFGLAMAETLLGDAERFERAAAPLALIIAPTRELALQVKRELDWLYAFTGATITTCVGGMDIRAERRALEDGTHIVVGTPGRLRDHFARKALVLDAVRAVVLDEADEMLDLGFRDDLEFMLEAAPDKRRTLLFSATVAAPIARLAERYQNNALRIVTKGEERQHTDIEYRALMVAPRDRENAIVNVLRYYEAESALVFCNTRAAVSRMLARFSNRGFSVVALSGELSQSERSHALQALRDGRARVCIATDVAARGIDLPKLDLVVHADLPSNAETLLHRSGRTGRAGRKGISALIVDARGRGKVERLLRSAKLDVTWANAPSAEEVLVRDRERLLADPLLNDAALPEEADAAAGLLEAFSPEQLAVAVMRLAQADRSAPEDIETVALDTWSRRDAGAHDGARPMKGGKASREFENSLWITLSVGRKHNAEPRWLIPLLCNSGEMTKADIGYIRIKQNRTHVELNAGRAEPLLDAIGPDGTLEKNVRVQVLDGRPDFGKPDFDRPKPDHKKRKDRKPHAKKDGPFKKAKAKDDRESTKKEGWAAKKKPGAKRKLAAGKKNKPNPPGTKKNKG